MEFTLNKETKTVNIKRQFAADRDLVWEAWTNPEILDQWWAPKPMVSKTKSMDFKVGGKRLYAMITPEGQERWAAQEYTSISPKTNFKFLSTFVDQDGNANSEFSTSEWDLNFIEQNETTTVDIYIKRDNLAELELLIETGFKTGMAAAFENLTQYIEAKFRLRRQNKTENKARVATYLNFPGNTEEAFMFYKSVFKTEFINGIKRFGDIPPDANHPPVADSIKKMVLHVELPITGNHVLMATDAPEEMGFTLTRGNNMHICIEPETREEAKRIFEALSEGGNITMPLEDMFFGAYFGEFSDKFGINWMINVVNAKQ